MALSTATIVFDLHDYFGDDFTARRVKAWTTTNAPDQTIHDTSTGETRVGSDYATVADDGTGSFSHWVPGADANPTTWQTYYHFDVPDRTASGGRRKLSLGPFTVTRANKTVTNKALTSNVATLTTSAAHGLVVGDEITVRDVDATFNGTHTITAVPTTTTLSYAKTAANVASTATTGTVATPLTALVEEQVATPTATASDYADAAETSAAAADASADDAATSAAAAQTARTGAETAQTGAEAARDAAVDISNIATSDDVVSTLVEGTAGAGPLTRAALSATIEAGVQTHSPFVLLEPTEDMNDVPATAPVGSLVARKVAPTVTLTIPAGTVSSDLTGFVTRIDLADMSGAWWAGTSSDGGNIRVKDGGVEVPIDLTKFRRDGRTGELFFKADLTAASDNVFTVEVVSGATAPAATDPIGRNAVWSDYDAVFINNFTTNRNGGTAATVDGTVYSYAIDEISPNLAEGHQGVTFDADGNFYILDTTLIVKYDSDWNELDRNTTALTDTGIAGVNHFGDGTVKDGELYVVVETWPAATFTNQHVTVWNLDTLAFVRSYDISAQGHEVSGLCWNADDAKWYVTDYTSAGNTLLHTYNEDFSSYLGTWAHGGASIVYKQGVTYQDGYFYIPSDNGASGRIYKVAADGSGHSVVLDKVLQASSSLEGLEIDKAGNIYVLQDNMTSIRRVYRLAPNWLGLTGAGNTKIASGLTKRTNWTMACSISAGSGRGSFLSYQQQSDATNTRETLALRASTGTEYGSWNNSDGWVFDTPATTPDAYDAPRVRLHATHTGTTERQVYRDGVLRNTDPTPVAQRPGGTGDALYIGAESSAFAERATRGLNYIYLRNNVLTAAWIAAEQASWEGDSFYTAPAASPGGEVEIVGWYAGA